MTQSQGIVETGNGSAATAEVRRLLAMDKCKQAVELAKENHKKRQSPESQQLLIDAYTARIAQFLAKGAIQDARTLIKLVSDRFPGHRSALVNLQIRSAAAEGRIDELIAPLTNPNVSTELREAIDLAIRRDLVDLPLLANCKTLPEDHPLRISASAVWKAFVAAATGPLTDAEVGLPEISRRSPLAGWKMFVRALAAYYRNEDDACRRSLESIPPDAAVAKLGTALLAMLDPAPATAPTGIAAVIRQRAAGGDKAFRDALAKLETAYTSYDPAVLTRALRGAAQACAASRPDLTVRLNQHVSVRCMMVEAPVEMVRSALGPARKEAYYWRLAAMAFELMGQPLGAACWWERFLQHGIAEGMFASNGKEAALIYLRIGTLLSEKRERDYRFNDPRERLRMTRDLYRGQPDEIAAIAPTADSEDFKRALDPNWVFRRSAELWPDSKTFVAWRQWAEESDKHDKQLQLLGEVWRRLMPADPQAPLLLAKLAESRKAFSLALRHLADAEAIDAMNPEVRKARLRLTLGTTFRHFKEKKPHLIERDLADLAALPAMREGDRPAFLEAMGAGLLALKASAVEAQAKANAIAHEVGVEMARMLMGAIPFFSKMSVPEAWPVVPLAGQLEPAVAADTAARSFLLTNGLSFPGAMHSPSWLGPLKLALQERPCRIPTAHLLAIGSLEILVGRDQLAYLAAGAGLESVAGTTAARFLLLRAQSIPSYYSGRRDQCLRAASELARTANDAVLIDSIASEKARFSSNYDPISAPRNLGDELISQIIKQERMAVDYPENRAAADRYLVALGDEPERRSFAGGSPFTMIDEFGDDDDDDDFDDDDFDDDEPVFGFGSGKFNAPNPDSPAMKELRDQFGSRVPSPQEMFSTNPELAARVLRELGLGGITPEMLRDMFSGGAGPFSSGKKKKRSR